MAERTRERTPDAGRTRGAYRAHHWALGAFVLLGAVQIFLAGLGVFSTRGDPGFEPHRAFSIVIAAASLVLVGLAVVARAGARHIIGSVVVLVLAGFVQHLLASAGFQSAWLGGLHALSGLAIVGVPAWLFWDSDPGRVTPPSAR